MAGEAPMDVAGFWNQKILKWEHAKYQRRSLMDVNAAVKSRMRVAQTILRHTKGQRVIELGCGSARLLPYLAEIGVSEYHGFDVSPVAISAAQERARGLKIKCQLQVASVDELDSLKGDMIFSLGLLDWLSETQLSALFAKCHSPHFLHSFSTPHRLLQRSLHQAYVFFLYGHKNLRYTPRYRTPGELSRLISVIAKDVKFFEHRSLGVGAFMHDAGLKVEL